MQKFFVLTTLFLLCNVILVMGQNKEVQAIEKAIEELRQAMIDGNSSKLRALTAKELSYGHSQGVIEDQEAFIEALSSGESNFTKIDLQDQTVEMLDDLAIVRHNLIGETHNTGESPADVNIGVMTIWQKKGKDWKLVARQAFKR